MQGDPCGNLMDWANVIDKMEDLKKTGRLHENQKGLTWILKYRSNWRLREIVLEQIKCIEEPGEELLQEVLNIIVDNGIYTEARILAVSALSEIFQRRTPLKDTGKRIDRGKVVESMKSILQSPQAPILLNAVERALCGMREMS